MNINIFSSVCTPDQLDQLESCPSYKAIGFCTSEDPFLSSFMTTNCFFRCGNCQRKWNNRQKAQSCQSYKELGLCDRDVGFPLFDLMVTNCNATCGNCIRKFINLHFGAKVDLSKVNLIQFETTAVVISWPFFYPEESIPGIKAFNKWYMVQFKLGETELLYALRQ